MVPYTQWTVLQLKDNLVHHLSHDCGMCVFWGLKRGICTRPLVLLASGSYLLSRGIRQGYVWKKEILNLNNSLEPHPIPLSIVDHGFEQHRSAEFDPVGHRCSTWNSACRLRSGRRKKFRNGSRFGPRRLVFSHGWSNGTPRHASLTQNGFWASSERNPSAVFFGVT